MQTPVNNLYFGDQSPCCLSQIALEALALDEVEDDDARAVSTLEHFLTMHCVRILEKA